MDVPEEVCFGLEFSYFFTQNFVTEVIMSAFVL